MEDPILQLRADDLWRALEEVDLVDLLAAWRRDRSGGTDNNRYWLEYIRPANGAAGIAAGRPADELVLLRGTRAAVRCVLPGSGLRLCYATTMLALAASSLLAAKEATVALLASGDAVRCHLTMLACHIEGIGHISLTSASDRSLTSVDGRVLDLLDRAGIELSVVSTVGEAVWGANLLIATGPGHSRLTYAQVRRPAMLVNLAGRDLPDELVDAVDQLYVNDIELLAGNTHRHFVRVHLREGSRGEPDTATAERPIESAAGAWSSRRRIDADLHQVLSSHRPYRTQLTGVLLFELFATKVLDLALACRIRQTALERGLGVWLPG